MDILVVDDDAIAVMMLRHALAPLGHDVQIARTGEEAIAQFQNRPCRLIISDWLMPGMDGVTLCQHVRHLNPPNYVYFILLTAWPRDLDVVEGLSAGADDILFKPFDPAELRVRIRNAERVLNLEELAAAQRALEESEARLLGYTHSLEAANDSLRKTQALLEKKNERLNNLYRMAQKFVDNVSHEFRTPVTVVKEYAALIAEGVVGPVTAEQHRFLNIIAERADDLNIIVDDMLDCSRLDAGMFSVVRQSHAMHEIVEHVRPVLERKAALRSARLLFELDDELPEIYADAEKVGRVLINLVVNAIKFCGDPPEVRVRAQGERDGPGVAVSVTDNGPGIDQVRQAEIFDRFKQLGGQGEGSSKGFGLGLSIVKELVELNLGRLELESSPGKGTTFRFTLPPAEPLEVTRRYLDNLNCRENSDVTLTLLMASMDTSGETGAAGEVDLFLGRMLQCGDLMFRVAPRKWAILSPVAEADLDKMLARLTAALDESNRNRPGAKLPPIRYEIQGTWPVEQSRAPISAFLDSAIRIETRSTSRAL